MKSEFITWYQTVAIAPQPTNVDTRWGAVEALATHPNPGQLEALLRTAFGWKHVAADTAANRSALAGGDGSIGDQEFAVLAGATLAVILRKELVSAARAAVMITTAHLAGLRQLAQPMDLVGFADVARTALSNKTRQRPALTVVPTPTLVLDAAKLAETSDINEKMNLIVKGCQASLERATASQVDLARRVAECLAIQDEELNMLWWLQGGHSGLTGQSFGEISLDQRALIFAADLAKATHALPGAPSVAALLSQAGVAEAGTKTIFETIQGLPMQWIKEIAPDSISVKISPLTTPVLEGFKRRLEVEGADSWHAGWSGVCGIAPDAAITPMKLATQLYSELLLLK